MKKRNLISWRLLTFAAVLLLLCTCLLPPLTAGANSAIRFWSGVDATGALLTEDCPLIVEHEKLVLNVPQAFTMWSSDHAETSLAEANYTIFNPTDSDVTVRLAFPFLLPDYGGADPVENVRAAYSVSFDGQEIPHRVRYTAAVGGEEFDVPIQLARLRDGYEEDAFFSPSMTVTRLTLCLEGGPAASSHVALATEWTPGEDLRLLSEDAFVKYAEDDKTVRLVWSRYGMTGDGVFTLTYVGEAETPSLDWFLYDDRAEDQRTDCTFRVSLLSTEKLMLADYIVSRQAVEDVDEVIRTDVYNAWLDGVRMMGDDVPAGVVFSRAGLIGWFEYELTFPAHSRKVNTVTAPLFPDVDEGWEPAIFTFTYLLSPAARWGDFGRLDVEIRTPLYLSDPSLSGFEKTSEGYAASFDGLPQGELTFSLCTSKTPKRITTSWGYLAAAVIILLVIIGVFFIDLAVVLIIVIIVGVQRAAKKQKTKGKE